MDTQTIQRLRHLNNEFYRHNHASFSATRQSAWPGWERLADHLGPCAGAVLDIACGNLRFKSFLESRGKPAGAYYAVDSCVELLPEPTSAAFQELDIVKSLCDDRLAADIAAPACDLTVCFGFMHHVPTAKLRGRLIDALLEMTRENGLVAVSFWRFAQDQKMLAKAQATTERGCADLSLALEEGDYLLGWEDAACSYRYCHSFSEEELDALVERCKPRAKLIDRYEADGRTGSMNGYLVFRVA